MSKYKTETLEQYLARGGKITKLAKSDSLSKVDLVKSTVVGPANILSLDDASLFYGDNSKPVKPKKITNIPRVDFNALPESIKKRLLAKFKEEMDVDQEEEYEQESIEIEDTF